MDVDDATFEEGEYRFSDNLSMPKRYNEFSSINTIWLIITMIGISCLTQGMMKHLWIR